MNAINFSFRESAFVNRKAFIVTVELGPFNPCSDKTYFFDSLEEAQAFISKELGERYSALEKEKSA